MAALAAPGVRMPTAAAAPLAGGGSGDDDDDDGDDDSDDGDDDSDDGDAAVEALASASARRSAATNCAYGTRGARAAARAAAGSRTRGLEGISASVRSG